MKSIKELKQLMKDDDGYGSQVLTNILLFEIIERLENDKNKTL